MTEPKITREMLEEWKAEADSGEHAIYSPEILSAILTLALQAVAMQPRPIEEAPKDGTRVLGWNPNWYDWNTVACYGADDWRVVYSEGKLLHQPTHFIPLNSLPEPRR